MHGLSRTFARAAAEHPEGCGNAGLGRALLLVTTLALGGCSGSTSTTGKRIDLATRVAVDEDAGSEFTTAEGWRVKLDKAALAIGALHYFDGEPAVVRREAPARGALERFAMLFEGVAHAHPGHYQTGNALGEMLEPASVDLFSAPTKLGRGEGVTGTFRSARFTFANQVLGAAAKELGGKVALVEGTATKAGDANAKEIHFRLTAGFADITANVTRGEVAGCEFVQTDVETDGTVTLTLKPSIWFDLVDFTDVPPGTSDAPTEVPKGELAQIGFALGLVQLTAYEFTFSE
jgi:hypothetical protein